MGCVGSLGQALQGDWLVRHRGTSCLVHTCGALPEYQALAKRLHTSRLTALFSGGLGIHTLAWLPACLKRPSGSVASHGIHAIFTRSVCYRGRYKNCAFGQSSIENMGIIPLRIIGSALLAIREALNTGILVEMEAFWSSHLYSLPCRHANAHDWFVLCPSFWVPRLPQSDVAPHPG